MSVDREKHLKLLYLCFLILIAIVSTLIVFIFEGIPQPSIVYHIGSLRVPYTNIDLTYIGFVLPLSISVAFIILYIEYADKIDDFSGSGFLLVITFLAVLSYITPPLQFITRGVGAHLNIIIFILTAIFWIRLAYQKNMNEFIWLTYPLFFLVGAISDLDSLAFFNAVYFGGGFLYDGDFIIPLFFLTFSPFVWYVCNPKSTSVPTL
jgi:hypothetical protein